MPPRSLALPIALACLLLAAWMWLPATRAASQDDPAPYLTNLHADPDPVAEGSPLTFSAEIVDPGTPQTYSLTLDWGDGLTQVVTYAAGTPAFQVAHTYADDLPTNTPADPITLTADLAGAAAGSQRSLQISVTNALPVVQAGLDEQIDQGARFTRTGSFSDPGADIWAASVDYGAGDGPQPLPLDGASFELAQTYSQPGAYTVTVRILDDDHGLGQASFHLVVRQTLWRFILPIVFP